MTTTVKVRRVDRLMAKALRRQERRWRAVATGRSYAYGVPAVDLYVEALRLTDALTERSVRLMTEPELDALHEATHADLAERAAGLEPPLAWVS